MSGQPQVTSQRFGSYTLARKLGEGGMAAVWLAETVDQRSDLLQVALKFMKPITTPGVDLADLFATEGDVMGLLRHPSLVQLYEIGKQEGLFFLAMEYCSGGDLADLIAALAALGRPFPPSVALQLGIDLLRGLAYVHQAQGVRGTSLGLVHGDINPANIFLSIGESRAKLGDFGVVSSVALGGGLPDGMAAGKLHYLSPEQAQGKPLTAASDLFSIGVVMFELLLGSRPFEGKDADEVLEKISSGRWSAPGAVSAQLTGIFEKALAKSPKNRFPTAGAFAAELLRYQLDSGLQDAPGALGELIQEALQIVT